MTPKRIFNTLIALIITAMTAAASTPTRPDFAFPEKVSQNARRDLDRALSDGNDAAALRAALNLTLAQNEIDSDRMPRSLELLDSIGKSFSTPAPKAVCDLIRATIYTDYFRSQQWTIERRPELPAGTQAPDDYTQWNGRQFEARVSELLNSALANPDALLATPLRNYDALLAVSSKQARATYIFYPSLLDFIGGKAIDLISSFRTQGAVALADEYRTLLNRLNADRPAPLITGRIAAIMNNPADMTALRNRLTSLYREMGASEYSGEALIALGDITDANDIEACRATKELIDSFLAKYPSYLRAANLRNILASLIRKRAEIDVRTLVVPGQPLHFDATSFNTPAVTVTLYRLPASRDTDRNEYCDLPDGKIPPTFKAVGSRKLTFPGTAPFKTSVSDSITVDLPGCYILVAEAPGMQRESNPRIIRATALAAGALTYGPSTLALVVNPLTGRPVEGASLFTSSAKQPVATTGADGIAPVRTTDGNLLIRPEKGSDRYAPYVRVWQRGQLPDSLRRYYVEAFTDLALYHPGDTMRFAAVVYSIKERYIEAAAEASVSAVVYDANNQPVDTIEAVADRFGRIEGEVTLPDDGRLNGRYSIVVKHGNARGRTYFTVSDYKLPSFDITLDPAATDTPEKGAVTLSGTVMTYSGMPVQGAAIAITIQREYIWRHYGPAAIDKPFEPLHLTATTDASGKWTAVIGASELEAAGRGSWLSASVTATSPAGESHETRQVFATGPSLRIRANLPEAINTTAPVKLPVEVYGPAGTPVGNITIGYVVTHTGQHADTVASGQLDSTSPMADWSSIAPGTYDITFSIDGDSRSCYGIALYNPSVDRSPSADLIWTPDRSVTLGTDRTTEILLGTSMDTTWVLFTLYDSEEMIERRWISLPAGMHRIPVVTDHGGSPGLRATFFAAGRYTSQNVTIDLRPAIDPRGLTIKAESMRDHTVPGSAEKWTFKVVNALGTPVESAVMIDLYNQALDALSPFRWYLHVNSPRELTLWLTNPGSGHNQGIYLYSTTTGRNNAVSVNLPSWQLYGQTLAPQTARNGIMIRGSHRMYKSAATMVKDEMAEAEAEESTVTMAEYASADMAAPMPASAGGAMLDESAVETDSGEAGAGDEESRPFAYRDAETPLALFRPMLTTGRDGSLELSFTMPDANATWALQAIAFTDDMRCSSLSASVVAAKPVMVKPNLPRFLRRGDSATVLSSVMNATDSAVTADVAIEIFDPMSGRVISSSSCAVELAAGATSEVGCTLDAPADLTMIGFRVKASTPFFADGEQAILPVLEAATPVIDSAPFYMGPDTREAVVTLPAATDATDAVTTLEFCENPVWYVVTALPGISPYDPATAPQAADLLFSSAMARGLIGRYPAIAEALADWSSRGSSAQELTSMLERNPDLKGLLLQATPWVMDARSDTERMQRLALLFDFRRVDAAIGSAIELLGKLNRSDGGWAWIAGSDKSSEWATTTVASRLALLDQYGFTPSDKRLARMTAGAIAYLDSLAARRYATDPSSPQIAFAALRSLFPGVKASATTERILADATSAVVKGWKEWPLASRPEAAMLLWRRDYRSVAAGIMDSMREFMVSDPDKGSWFPSIENRATGYISFTADALRAFALIDPGCSEIDGLRHWLVVQKQATDWGSSAYATEVVAAILASSQEWIGNVKGSAIEADGHRIDLPAIDRRTGYFRVPLGSTPSRVLSVSVTKGSATPAWGALMRRSLQPLTSVEASGSDDLRIEKSIIGPDTLRAGDKVTVRLVIHVGRNLNYVAITDDRAACFEPVDQLPSTSMSEGVIFYIEPRDTRTSLFATTMPKGTYVVSYDLYVNNAGSFASGIATAASQYAPEITARSAGSVITVNPASK